MGLMGRFGCGTTRLCGGVVLLVLAGPVAWGGEATLIGDAHVSSAQPTVNSGSLSNLRVGGGYTALVQFDLGVLPAGTTAAQITKATLRVYCNRMDAGGAGVRLTGPAGIARIHENGLTGGRDDQCAGAPFHVRPINVQRPGRPGGGVDRQHQCHQ